MSTLFSRRMIPFTPMPPIEEMRGIDLAVRALLLGTIAGFFLGPVVWAVSLFVF